MIGRVAPFVAFVWLAAGCAHNVGQDEHSGADAKEKGAKPITLENGEGKAKGIVTYPGGDRTDWKVVEIPDGKRGTLNFNLTWVPPRPGLQLAFDVFDEWNYPVTVAKKTSKKRSHGKQKSATVDNAKGKYFVRIYAVGRGDAGTYKLTIEFKEASAITGVDPLKLEVADPPKLAEVPPPDFICGDDNFDQKKSECKTFCPSTNPPKNWPACKGICPDPPDVNVPACLKTMPCPKPPDRRIVACKPSAFPKCPDVNNPDPDNPNCDNATAPPAKGIVLDKTVTGSETNILFSVGEGQGVKKDWKCKVLRGDSENYIDGGDVQIIRIDKKATLGKVKLTADTLQANPHVKCSAPPR